MSIYVDALFPCIKNKNWRYNESCHLVGDTEEELHSFAKKLGLKRQWFQQRHKLSHYDLNKSKRAKAVEMGAIEVSRKKIVIMLRSLK